MSTEPSGRSELMAELASAMPGFIGAAVRFNLAVADQLGMPVADLQCLNALTETGATTAGQLAERVGLSTGAVTRMIDRLERSGYVSREADPADRRRVVVRLVPERMGELAPHFEPMGQRFTEQIADYSRERLEHALDFVREGRRITDEEATRLRREGQPHATRKRPT